MSATLSAACGTHLFCKLLQQEFSQLAYTNLFAVCNTALARFPFLKRPVASTTNLESCFLLAPASCTDVFSHSRKCALFFYCACMLSLSSACVCSLVRCVSFSCLPLAALLSAALFVTFVWAHTHKHTHTKNKHKHTYTHIRTHARVQLFGGSDFFVEMCCWLR